MDNSPYYYEMGDIPKSILATLTDAGLEVAVAGTLHWNNQRVTRRYLTRPDLHWYPKGPDCRATYKQWLTLTPASQHRYTLQVKRKGDVCEVWMDGQFIASFLTGSKYTYTVKCTSGVGTPAIMVGADGSEPDRYLFMDIAAGPHRGSTKFAIEEFAPAARDATLTNIRLASQHVDPGLARWVRQSSETYR